MRSLPRFAFAWIVSALAALGFLSVPAYADGMETPVTKKVLHHRTAKKVVVDRCAYEYRNEYDRSCCYQSQDDRYWRGCGTAAVPLSFFFRGDHERRIAQEKHFKKEVRYRTGHHRKIVKHRGRHEHREVAKHHDHHKVVKHHEQEKHFVRDGHGHKKMTKREHEGGKKIARHQGKERIVERHGKKEIVHTAREPKHFGEKAIGKDRQYFGDTRPKLQRGLPHTRTHFAGIKELRLHGGFKGMHVPKVPHLPKVAHFPKVTHFPKFAHVPKVVHIPKGVHAAHGGHFHGVPKGGGKHVSTGGRGGGGGGFGLGYTVSAMVGVGMGMMQVASIAATEHREMTPCEATTFADAFFPGLGMLMGATCRDTPETYAIAREALRYTNSQRGIEERQFCRMEPAESDCWRRINGPFTDRYAAAYRRARSAP